MKFPRIGVFLLVVLLVLTTGCIFGAKEYTISGKLVDEDNAPIDGAQIVITGGTSATITEFGEDGSWTAKVKGTVTVTPQHEYYQFTPANAEVKKETKDIDFVGEYLGPYLISGRVVDEDGQAITGAKVIISGQVNDEILVDENGNWTAEARGTVTVTAIAANKGFDPIKITEATSDLELLGSSLFVWYKLDEAGNKVPNAKGLDHATVTGTLSITDSPVGKGIVLDGSSYIQMPNGILSQANEVTIATWVRNDEDKYWARIFSFGNVEKKDAEGNVIDDGVMFLAAQGSNFVTNQHLAQLKLDFAAYNVPDSAIFVMGPKLNLGEWYHVAVTISETTASVYVDGELVGETVTVAKPSDLGFTEENYIGKSNSRWPDPLLIGAIDDFRIYSKVLTVDEIAALANNQK